jgi:hypothetical protein
MTVLTPGSAIIDRRKDQHLGFRFLPPFEYRLGKLLSNGTAVSLAELDVNRILVPLAHVLHNLVELLRQLFVVVLSTLGGLACSGLLHEPLRTGLDDDLCDAFGLW